jgi:hypothetical protein
MSKVISEIKSIFIISFQRFFNTKTVVLMAVLTFIFRLFLNGIIEFSIQMNYNIAPWMFSFLVSDSFLNVILMCGAIYFFSSVPFMQYYEMYGLIRMGRKRWGIHRIIMLYIHSLGFMLSVFFISIIALLPHIRMETIWGKLIHTFSLGDWEGKASSLLYIPYESLAKYNPIELTIITILIGSLVVFFLSLVMFAASLFLSRLFAVCVSMFLVIMPILVDNAQFLMKKKLSYISPIFWMRVTQIGEFELGASFPDFPYIITSLLLSCTVLILLILWKIERIDFNWYREE